MDRDRERKGEAEAGGPFLLNLTFSIKGGKALWKAAPAGFAYCPNVQLSGFLVHGYLYQGGDIKKRIVVGVSLAKKKMDQAAHLENFVKNQVFVKFLEDFFNVDSLALGTKI